MGATVLFNSKLTPLVLFLILQLQESRPKKPLKWQFWNNSQTYLVSRQLITCDMFVTTQVWLPSPVRATNKQYKHLVNVEAGGEGRGEQDC